MRFGIITTKVRFLFVMVVLFGENLEYLRKIWEEWAMGWWKSHTSVICGLRLRLVRLIAQ